MTTPCSQAEEIAALRVASAVHDEWRHSVDQKLDAILAQTTATNGRIRALESWRDRQAGGVAVVGFLCSVVGAGVVALVDFLRK